jgi:hypothetical protein
MAFIGNTSTTQSFAPAIDYFNGDGTTVAFTLSRPVASVAQVQVVVNNVAQNPSSAYTVSGNTITFTSAPSSGTSNIYVYYTSPITQVVALPQDPQVFGKLQFSSLGARITGDFSNATVANRVIFQTSTTNGQTALGLIPNGTSTQTQLLAFNSTDPANSSYIQALVSATEARINSGQLGTGTNLPMTFYTGGSERVRINTSGNVGIGTSSPVNKLDIVLGTNRTYFDDGGGAFARINGVNAANNAYAPIAINGSQVLFTTSATERARIDSSGNLLVGTTTQFGGAQATISSSVAALGLYCSGASGTPAMYVGKASNDASTSQVLMQFLYNSGTAGLGQINGNGGSQAAFGSYSDRKLKENITDLPTQIANICALHPVEFDYKDGSGHQIGFIAQEMQEVYPDAVGVGQNGMLTVTGWNKTEAYLVKAIQEQQAIITQLQADVAALKSK